MRIPSNHRPRTLGRYIHLGTRSRPPELARQGRGLRRGLSQPPAHSWHPRATLVAPARRTAGTPVRPSLRNRRDAACASAGASQHPQAAARAHRRLQPRAADAAADWRRHAAQSPGPRGRPATLNPEGPKKRCARPNTTVPTSRPPARSGQRPPRPSTRPASSFSMKRGLKAPRTARLTAPCTV